MKGQRWIYYCELEDKLGHPVYKWLSKPKGKVITRKIQRLNEHNLTVKRG